MRRETKQVWASERQMSSGRFYEELIGPLIEDGWKVETWADLNGKRHYVLSRETDGNDTAAAAQLFLQDKDREAREREVEAEVERERERERNERFELWWSRMPDEVHDVCVEEACANLDPALVARVPSAVMAEVKRLHFEKIDKEVPWGT